MKLLIDTREQAPLEFPVVQDVEIIRQTLVVGDYSARHLLDGRELPDPWVVERKALGDLWSSFSHGYEREKAKWQKAQQLGLHYLLAIEGTVSEVLDGHRVWYGGEIHESGKTGLAQLRQLCSIKIRYGVDTMFFTSRKEMALYLMEFFLASGRWLRHQEADP